MKSWYVTIPCTMAVMVQVDAADEKSAKEAALSVGFSVNITPDEDSEKAKPVIVDFSTHERIAYGNVYCGCICDMDVEEKK